MTRALYTCILIALAITAFAAAPAAAAVRYASPTGTGPAATCAVIDPCSIVSAVNSAFTSDGDEVILALGQYNVGSTELDILDGVDVHGLGAPSQTRIVSTSNTAVYLGNTTAKLRNVEVSHSTGTSAAVTVSIGTVDHVIAKSENGNACGVYNATIRDSICASARSGGAGVFVNISGFAYAIVLRNVTAIGSGAVNSYGLYAGASGATTTVAYNAMSVIARGTTYDIYASQGSGATSSVTLDHSNFQNVLAVGGSTITSSALNSNQTTAPVFVDAAAKNYHQATGSPTINAGAVDGSSGTTDVDGDLHTLGGTADIGGDEYDSTAPAPPTVVSPVTGTLTADTTPTVSGTAVPLTTVTVFANAGPVGTAAVDGSGNWSLDVSPALTDGAFAITATAANANNVASTASPAVNLSVDATAPTVSITGPVNGSPTSDTTPPITFSVGEANPGTTACSVDGGASFACASNDNLAALGEGAHTLSVTHTDAVGNSGSSSTAFSVDTTAPTVAITGPANGSLTKDGTPPITFSVGEANPGTTACSVDGGTAFACASNDNLAALADGAHKLDVRHTDAVGNSGSSSTAFSVDTTAPQSKIGKGPKRKTFKRKSKFTFSANEANATFECKLDKRAYVPCKSPFVKRVKPGKHTLWFVATDVAGNRDATPAKYRWRVLAR